MQIKVVHVHMKLKTIPVNNEDAHFVSKHFQNALIEFVQTLQ